MLQDRKGLPGRDRDLENTRTLWKIGFLLLLLRHLPHCCGSWFLRWEIHFFLMLHGSHHVKYIYSSRHVCIRWWQPRWWEPCSLVLRVECKWSCFNCLGCNCKLVFIVDKKTARPYHMLCMRKVIRETAIRAIKTLI